MLLRCVFDVRNVDAQPSPPWRTFAPWIDGANMTVPQLADHIGVARATLSLIINSCAGVTAKIDLRLNQVLGTRERLWLDLQKQRDL